ncbi:hypothetical protein ACFOEE_02640 [Pseudoalteromonas fenneropenaei]|uniref:Uncharacterized protein n=1 Tax=Pseudoalteromonas fenneropenaei TaxID=1737459 RepID=A0ABV7CFS8_9GAMM
MISSVKDNRIEAEKFYAKLEYAPALVAGELVAAAKTNCFEDNIGFIGDHNDSVKRGFLNNYSRLQKINTSKDLTQAEVTLKELHDDHGKNTSEQVLYHYLASQLAQLRQDWPRYEYHVLHAFTLRSKLPQEYRLAAAKNMLDWYMYAQQFGDAKRVAASFGYLKGINIQPETVEKAVSDVVSFASSQPAIVQQVEFSYLPTRLLTPVRREIKMQIEQGQLQQVQLRCAFHVETLPISKEMRFEIKPEFGGCQILIKGTDNTRLQISQTGQLLL